MHKLHADGHYGTSTKDSKPNSGVDRMQGFRFEWSVPVRLEKIPTEKYTRQLNVAAPPRRDRNQNRGFDMPFGEMGGQP
jgi:hypothetical protein